MQELNQVEDIKTTYRKSKEQKRLFFFFIETRKLIIEQLSDKNIW